jgi:hypothetical protein
MHTDSKKHETPTDANNVLAVVDFVNWLRDNYSTTKHNQLNKPLHYNIWRKDFTNEEYTTEQLWSVYNNR